MPYTPPKLLSDRELNIIRGKAIVGHASSEELMAAFGHIDMLEAKLDESDHDDMFGSEGWRHWFGHPDSD